MRISVITPSIRPEFLDQTQESLERQTFKDFEWHVELGLRNQTDWGLPKDWNKLLKRCTGDIVVMLQDCIKIPDNALEHISQLDHTMMAYTFPVGKSKYYEGARVKWDWRKDNYGEIKPHEWEIDFASAPLSLFKDVGGFDEDFANGWSWENVEIAHRASMAGYRFFSDKTLPAVAIDHDKLIKHPYRSSRTPNAERAEQTRISAINGDWKLNYL